MSSILTNTSAMVALQTLKGINSSLTSTQSEISTGKTVATAKDNAAVWSISKVMESDVKGFEGISNSLALGESTVAVARKAAETVTDLLTQMKTKIVSAQDDNQDRTKIQTDIAALKDQISSVVGAAQFNGLNLVDGSNASTDILSSLDRSLNGDVASKRITVNGVDFAQDGYTAADVFSGSSAGASTDGDTASFSMDKTSGTGDLVIDASALAEGDTLTVNIGGQKASYTVTADDIAGSDADEKSTNVAYGLKNAITALGIDDLTIDHDATAAGTLNFTNGGSTDLTLTAQYKNADAGDLSLLSTIDVTNTGTLDTQLTNIEDMIQIATQAAADFGSAETQISTQSDFISSLTDSMKAGIGSLVDADMEETSARLQALQTQQQLGIQSLSMANQAPQNILSLFK